MKAPDLKSWPSVSSSDGLLKEYDSATIGDQHTKSERLSRGTMRRQLWEVLLASCLLIIPMLGLSITLIALVYTQLMSEENSTYSEGIYTGLPIGSSAYFISYPAARLAFIASVSSTLATILISPAMVLFSYLAAYYMASSSDARHVQKLPSPYQFELLVRILDARIMAIWSFICYGLSSKGKRMRIIPELWRAAAMMALLMLIALLINLADTWLHLTASSVQYTSLTPTSADYGPGRRLPATCLNLPTVPSLHDPTNVWANCSVNPAGGTDAGGLIDQTEFILTANNLSTRNQVYSVGGQALLANPPIPSQLVSGLDIDFQATSFASHTTCRMVTVFCGVTANSSNPGSAAQETPFVCNVKEAGLDVSGNFSDISSKNHSNNNTFGIPGGSVATVKSNSIGFQYFNDAKKTNRSSQLGPTSYSSPSLWWAFIFTLDTGWESNRPKADTVSGEILAETQIAPIKNGGFGGILSCNTNLSQVVYAFSNGSLSILESKPLNNTAAVPFVSAMSQGFGYDQLQQGIQRAAAIGTDSLSIANAFASTYDETMVALPAGVLLRRPADTETSTHHIETLVTRVPKAPFLALLALDLLYVCIGIGLMITALSALFLGERVQDAQTRLSVAAVVAECFESPVLGEDATTIDGLFAERRGLKTRRVAFTKRDSGGRQYQQMVWREKAESYT